jgi:arabinogalactan endo-1,4-beta-galactosidase
MKNIKIFFFLILFLLQQNIFAAKNATPQFAKGADISWLPQMEATGFIFYNDNGVAQDCFQILKDHGINTIRLRTWVNPSTNKTNGHCSQAETIEMALRAKAYGMRVMIDFHYSDTWADPGHQAKPAAWATHTFAQLLTDVYDYTFGFMTALNAAGVQPEWVQVGNETPSGMLFPDGSTSNWSQLAQLINKGYDAVKAVCPSAKVVLHLDQGNNNSRFRNWFDNAKTYGAKYDVVGLSYYPYWLSGNPDYTLSIDALGANLLDMASRYGKEVMVVETGGLDTAGENTKSMIIAVMNKLAMVPNNAGLGVIYWEPEGQNGWSGGYPLSAWGSGTKPQPTVALDAFLTTTTTIKSTFNVDMTGQDVSQGVYLCGTLTGWLFTPMTKVGQTNIYTTTLTLTTGSQHVYYFKNAANWNAGTRETVPAECAKSNTTTYVWPGDRAIFVPANDTVIGVKYSSCELVNTAVDKVLKDKLIEISPNPAKDYIKIKFQPDMNVGIINLYAMSGQKILSKEKSSGSSELVINAQGLKSGFYLLEVSSNNKTIVEKISVQNN